MLESLLLVLIASPVIYAVVKAFVNSKDYYEYDSKKARYVSKFNK